MTKATAARFLHPGGFGRYGQSCLWICCSAALRRRGCEPGVSGPRSAGPITADYSAEE